MVLEPTHPHPGARRPDATQDAADRDLAARYAPRILFDRHEPFLPSVVGYTIFWDDGYSPSFPRSIGLRPIGQAPAELAIEYAIWWDWDITHLYELEHIWTYVSGDGKAIRAEGSWHGEFQLLKKWDEAAALWHEGTHPIAYSQPGKHAFAGDPHVLELSADYTRRQCTKRAGTGGLLVTDLYKGVLDSLKTRGNSRLAKAYLKRHAFEPAFEWSQVFDVTPQLLLPWATLRDWIPQRLAFVLQRLKTGEGVPLHI